MDRAAVLTAYFLQLTMHMDQILAAAAFMQVIDILRDQQDLAVQLSFQPSNRQMRRVGLDSFKSGTAQIIKMLHQVWVAGKGLWRCHIFKAVAFP